MVFIITFSGLTYMGRAKRNLEIVIQYRLIVNEQINE